MTTTNSTPELPDDVTLKTIPFYRQPDSHRLLQAQVNILRTEAVWDDRKHEYSSARMLIDNSIFNPADSWDFLAAPDAWAHGDTGTVNYQGKTLIVPAHEYEASSVSGMPGHIIPVTKPEDMTSDEFLGLLRSNKEKLCTLNVDPDRRKRLGAINSAQVLQLIALMKFSGGRSPCFKPGRDETEKVVIFDNKKNEKDLQKKIEELVAETVKANREITARRVFHETARVWQTLQFIGDEESPCIGPMKSIMFPMASSTGELQDAVRILRSATHVIIYGQGDKVKLQ